jgi:hypothetical protein
MVRECALLGDGEEEPQEHASGLVRSGAYHLTLASGAWRRTCSWVFVGWASHHVTGNHPFLLPYCG